MINNLLNNSRYKILIFLIIFLLFLNYIPLNVPASQETTWWNNEWSYRQEIIIPIDTSLDISKYQPVDTEIIFDNICWAKDELEHSIRIIMQKNLDFEELESQIYDLDFKDSKKLNSCSIVFLIPESADGKEKYFVYYDQESKPAPNYPNRVDIDEGYYYFAPIPGLPFESSYYKIIQDENIIYGIAKEGSFLGTSTSHQVTILEDNVKSLTTPKDSAAFASFDYFYYYGTDRLCDFSSTIQDLISSKVFVDGNLMVKFQIESKTKLNDFKTTATYQYYYCPTEHKRIVVNVVHEALKDSKVVDHPIMSDSCGNIAGLQIGKMRSPSIEELNFGEMLHYMHVYAEDEIIQEYKLDLDPEYTEDGTIILQGTDDIDMGNRAWASFDEGKEGIGHAIIFDSNSVLKSGKDERDGIQIYCYEGSTPGVLGLESDLQSYFFHRNFIEGSSDLDLEVPKDYIVEFNAEFFSTKNGGYPLIDEEAKLFQSLIDLKPKSEKNYTIKEQTQKNSLLTAYIHNAASVPFGTIACILTGKDFPYITCELYKDEKLISTGLGDRTPINSIPSFADTSLVEKLKLAIGVFDLKNTTIFKKVRFQNIDHGKYVVKVFRENPILKDEKKFIGYGIIELNDNSKIHIICSSEASFEIKLVDQEENGIEGIEALLEIENTTIFKAISSEEGIIDLKAPSSIFRPYTLNLKYKGVNILKEKIKLGFLKSIKPREIEIKLSLYDLKINILDKWNLKPSFILNLALKNNENNSSIAPNIKENDEFIFQNLLPSDYIIDLSYKSYNLQDEITIDSNDKEIEYVFPVEYKLLLNIYNSIGQEITENKIIISREDKKIILTKEDKNNIETNLPPGRYDIKILSENNVIGQRKINLVGDTKLDLITNVTPIYPLIIFLFIIILFGSISLYMLVKKNYRNSLKILIIILVLSSIFNPWWTINGSSQDLDTSTNIFIYPAELVTLTETSDVIAGEKGLGSMDELFTIAFTLFTVLIIMASILIIANIVFEKYEKKKLSKFSLVTSGGIIISCVCLFYFILSMISKVGVGSFIGQDIINIKIPGENTSIPTNISWGPNLGFYLLLFAVIILIFFFGSHLRKKYNEFKVKEKKIIWRKNIIYFLKKIMPFIGIFMLIFLLVDIGFSKISDTFLHINPILVIIAGSLTLPRLLIRNYGWQMILKQQRINVSFSESLKIFLIGYFYGSITPGYLGQLMRIPYMKDKTNEPTGKLFINSTIETIVHTMSLYIMMVIGAILMFQYIPEALPIAIALIIANIIIYGYFFNKKRGEKTFKLLIKYSIPKKFKPLLTQFVNTFYNDFPGVKPLIKPFIFVIPTWFIIYAQIYILGISLDIQIPFLIFVMLYAIANIVSFIPITSAGLGTREATVVFLFSFYGIAPEKAIVLSLAGHLLTDVLTGFYGFIISTVEARNNKKTLKDLNIVLKEAQTDLQ